MHAKCAHEQGTAILEQTHRPSKGERSVIKRQWELIGKVSDLAERRV